MHEVSRRIDEIGTYLAEHAAEAEANGQLPDETAARLRATGIIRMLQPRQWGGYEADPCDFFEAVMATAARCGASGWVAGVVGVHPWEMALCDPKVQEEIWGKDPDVWMASPYAPMGRAKEVEGGYIFNGRWQFSSGTDHCKWIFLGGMLVEAAGKPLDPPQAFHFILPRSDYEIVEDSWNVVGLKGTGSKDIIVRDAFIPHHHAIDATKVLDGRAAIEAGREEPLYRTPWSAIFPNAITAAVIGICEGALASHVNYQKERLTVRGGRMSEDPWAMAAIGEAASEINASRTQMLSNVSAMYTLVCEGKEVPFELRAQGRRDQVRGSWRAVEAIDEVFARSGGGGLRSDQSLQRLWRDAHAGLNHAINVAGPVYQAYALTSMGLPLDNIFRLTI